MRIERRRRRRRQRRQRRRHGRRGRHGCCCWCCCSSSAGPHPRRDAQADDALRSLGRSADLMWICVSHSSSNSCFKMHCSEVPHCHFSCNGCRRTLSHQPPLLLVRPLLALLRAAPASTAAGRHHGFPGPCCGALPPLLTRRPTCQCVDDVTIYIVCARCGCSPARTLAAAANDSKVPTMCMQCAVERAPRRMCTVITRRVLGVAALNHSNVVVTHTHTHTHTHSRVLKRILMRRVCLCVCVCVCVCRWLTSCLATRAMQLPRPSGVKTPPAVRAATTRRHPARSQSSPSS
jgi:hypothetical protein